MSRRTSYARHLGIRLASRKEEEFFKWFLACLLFGKPIQTEIAEGAWHALIAEKLTSPQAVLRAGWDKLVLLLDRAHYVRYDFSTATKLLEVSRELIRRYGTLTNLLALAGTPVELSRRLQEFRHIGPVTARIFLREIKPIRYRAAGPAGKGTGAQAAEDRRGGGESGLVEEAPPVDWPASASGERRGRRGPVVMQPARRDHGNESGGKRWNRRR